jgi:hypothetical protein
MEWMQLNYLYAFPAEVSAPTAAAEEHRGENERVNQWNGRDAP